MVKTRKPYCPPSQIERKQLVGCWDCDLNAVNYTASTTPSCVVPVIFEKLEGNLYKMLKCHFLQVSTVVFFLLLDNFIFKYDQCTVQYRYRKPSIKLQCWKFELTLNFELGPFLPSRLLRPFCQGRSQPSGWNQYFLCIGRYYFILTRICMGKIYIL